MKNILSVGVIALLGVLSFYFFTEMRNPTVPTVETVILDEEKEARGAPTFTWSYHTFEGTDFPVTEISLTAAYEDGSSETKLIEKIQGSCNDYEDPDQMIYERSTMSMCYYAGYGHYYKVIEELESYAVQRRIFEEASPDYEPPILPFETIARF